MFIELIKRNIKKLKNLKSFIKLKEKNKRESLKKIKK